MKTIIGSILLAGVIAQAFLLAGSAIAQAVPVSTHSVGSDVTLAASDSPRAGAADVICPGTADEVCINQAIETHCAGVIAGCTVRLMNGVFHTTGPIVIDHDDVNLVGWGHCMWGGYNQPWTKPENPAGEIGTGCSQIRASATGFNLLEIRNRNAGGTGGDRARHRGIAVEKLYLVGKDYSGTGIYSAAAEIQDNVLISDNVIQRTSDGINVSLDAGMIEKNSVQDVANRGIVYQGILGRVPANLVYDVGGPCLESDSPSIAISGNLFGDCAGVLLQHSNHAALTGNSFTVTIGNAVSVVGSRGATITGNTFNDFEGRFGYAKRMPLSTDLITMDAASPGVVVSGNSMDTALPMRGYAINFGTSAAGSATGNTILGIWNNGGVAIHGDAATVYGNGINHVPTTSVPR